MLSWIDTNHSLSSNLAITHLVSLGHKKSPSSAVLTKTIFTEIVFWDIGCLSSATISHPEMPMSSLLLAIWKKSSNIPRSFCDYRNLPTAFCALTVLSPSASSRQSVSSTCAFRRTFLLSPSTITRMHLWSHHLWLSWILICTVLAPVPEHLCWKRYRTRRCWSRPIPPCHIWFNETARCYTVKHNIPYIFPPVLQGLL